MKGGIALSFLALFLSLVAADQDQVVPKVKLCDYDGCPEVSRIGLGTLHIGDKIGGLHEPIKVNEWIRAGLKQGINLFDCADVYPVEGGTPGDAAKIFGEALALTPGLRQKIVFVAKMNVIFPNTIDTSASHLLAQAEWFLQALQTDYLDIVLLHYPNSYMNATEIAEVFYKLKTEGKVKNFGVSNHYPSHMEVLQKALDKLKTGITLVTNEVEVSVWNPSYLNYDSNVIDHAYANGYRTLAWSALGGQPTGGFNRLFQKKGKRQTDILSALASVGAEMGVSDLATLALAWVLSHPSGIIPLIGTTQISRVESLVAALEISKNFTAATWWTIGNAGGLCPLADNQCNYKLYLTVV